MTDDSMSPRALIAAYKACARPSPASEAQMWATLAAAERARRSEARRAGPGRAGWIALAAGILLVAAWGLDLPRWIASVNDSKDMSHQAAHEAAPAGPEDVRARSGADGAGGEPEVGGSGAEGEAQPAAGDPAARAAGGEARPRRIPAGSRGSATESPRRPEPGPGEDGGDRVLAEMALLQRAQAALRGGRAEEALELLAQHAETFADGSMTEERLALRVLALCASGDTSHGAAEKAAFMRAHPRSTYAPRVAAACIQEQEHKDMSTGPR